MNRPQKHITLLTMILFLSAGLLILAGCKSKTESTAGAAEIEQKTCPVMGNPINPEVYTEYQGKKVYFCCAECVETFKKNPEQYLSKLPQFKEPNDSSI